MMQSYVTKVESSHRTGPIQNKSFESLQISEDSNISNQNSKLDEEKRVKIVLGRAQRRNEFVEDFKDYLYDKQGVRMRRKTNNNHPLHEPADNAHSEIKQKTAIDYLEEHLYFDDIEMIELKEIESTYTKVIKAHYNFIERDDPNGKYTVDVIKCLLETPQLLKIHNLTPIECILSFSEFITQIPNKIAEKEYQRVLNEPRDNINPAEIDEFNNKNPLISSCEMIKYYCILEKENEAQLKNLAGEFRKLELDNIAQFNLNEDDESYLINSRIVSKFIKQLLLSEANDDILNAYAIYIYPTNVLLTVRQVLIEYELYIKHFLEYTHECIEFIENNEFLKIFYSYKMNKGITFDMLIPVLSEQDDRNHIDLDLLDNLRRIFEEASGGKPIAQRDILIDLLKSDFYFAPYMKDQIIRRPPRKYRGILPLGFKLGWAEKKEKLSNVLRRFKKYTNEFTDWNFFAQHFTRRGYPMYSCQSYKIDLMLNYRCLKI